MLGAPELEPPAAVLPLELPALPLELPAEVPLDPDAAVPLELPAEPLEEPELPPGEEPLEPPTTTTVPCMNGWILQMYANVPAWPKVCDALWPL